jgi:hypothetical protein
MYIGMDRFVRLAVTPQARAVRLRFHVVHQVIAKTMASETIAPSTQNVLNRGTQFRRR